MKRLIATALAALCFLAAGYAQQEGFTTHIVKWYENLADISAKYGVPVDVIMNVNKMQDKTVTARQQLLIPISEKYWPETAVTLRGEPAQDNRTVCPEQTEAETVAEDVQTEAPVIEAKPTSSMSLGLVLPFGAGSATQRSYAVDFYSGVLMAAKEAGDEGFDLTLNVHDAADNMSASVLYEGNDIVIGPFRLSDMEHLATGAKDGSNIVVSPLDQKTATLATGNKGFVQAAAQASDQYVQALEYNPGDNFIVISSEQDKAAFEDVANALKAKGIAFKTCSCSVQGEIKGWENAYKEEITNRVIIAINSEAALNNAIRNMCIEESKGNIVCYAGSKAASYETIPVENLHRAHIHMLCSYFVDYNDPATLDFIHKYRALYNSEPNQFAFQGHDLALFLIKTYGKYGKGWMGLITEEETMDLLQSSFKFKRLEDGGLVNTASRKVEYTKDYRVELVK